MFQLSKVCQYHVPLVKYRDVILTQSGIFNSIEKKFKKAFKHVCFDFQFSRLLIKETKK